MSSYAFCFRDVLLISIYALSSFRLSIAIAQCEFQGLRDGSRLWSPGNDCSPRDCSSAKWPYPCDVQNYQDHAPTACTDARAMLQRTGKEAQHQIFNKQSMEPPAEPCYTRLTKIDLYTYSCLAKHEQGSETLEEESLRFSFKPPYCDGKLRDTTVMVEFNSRNVSGNPYFMVNQICRVFSFNSSAVQNTVFSSDAMHEIGYNCIGIGLQYKYPEVYYYLGLTNLPSGTLLNYTMVFLDTSKNSMRLVAATVLSPRKIHVVFLPIDGVPIYQLQAKSGDWIETKHVRDASPSAEFSNIPLKVNTVTVSVTPLREVCGEKECASITVTLFRSGGINTDVPANPGKEEPQSYSVILGVLVTVILLVVLGTTALVYRRYFRHKERRQNTGCGAGISESVIIILAPNFSVFVKNVLRILEREGLQVKPMQKIDANGLIHTRDISWILIVFDNTYTNARNENERIMFKTHLHHIFGFPPFWKKMQVVMSGGERRYPSHLVTEILQINSGGFPEFLEYLDKCDPFMWEVKSQRLLLIKSLKEKCQTYPLRMKDSLQSLALTEDTYPDRSYIRRDSELSLLEEAAEEAKISQDYGGEIQTFPTRTTHNEVTWATCSRNRKEREPLLQSPLQAVPWSDKGCRLPPHTEAEEESQSTLPHEETPYISTSGFSQPSMPEMDPADNIASQKGARSKTSSQTQVRTRSDHEETQLKFSSSYRSPVKNDENDGPASAEADAQFAAVQIKQENGLGPFSTDGLQGSHTDSLQVQRGSSFAREQSQYYPEAGQFVPPSRVREIPVKAPRQNREPHAADTESMSLRYPCPFQMPPVVNSGAIVDSRSNPTNGGCLSKHQLMYRIPGVEEQRLQPESRMRESNRCSHRSGLSEPDHIQARHREATENSYHSDFDSGLEHSSASRSNSSQPVLDPIQVVLPPDLLRAMNHSEAEAFANDGDCSCYGGQGSTDERVVPHHGEQRSVDDGEGPHHGGQDERRRAEAEGGEGGGGRAEGQRQAAENYDSFDASGNADSGMHSAE